MSERSESGPTYPAAALGTRRWNLVYVGPSRGGRHEPDQLRLYPVSARRTGAWAAGDHTAECPLRNHPAPDPDCSCGLYAFHLPEDPQKWVRHLRALKWRSPDQVMGVVAGWGEAQIHATGWRCERARVLALLLPASQNEASAALSAHYSAPVFSDPRELADWLQHQIQSGELPAHPVPQVARPRKGLMFWGAAGAMSLFALWFISSVIAAPALLSARALGFTDLSAGWMIYLVVSMLFAYWLIIQTQRQKV